MTAPHPGQFRSIFEARSRHSRALLELSRRQRELIEADDYSQLLVVLGEKQNVLEAMQELKARHPRLVDDWREARDQLPEDERAECERLLARAEHTLAELMDHEQQCTREMTRRRDATLQELQAVSRGTEVNRAYRDNLAPATHRHLDVGR